jgi:hypothetical protein
VIFPEGTDNRNYLVREIAAKTVFVMLYAGAIEGEDKWIRPNQVTRMSDVQAGKTDRKTRQTWCHQSLRSTRKAIKGRWYADNTREPIRDETIRYGLLEVGAAVERQDLPVTSSTPRYALARSFAQLLLCADKDFPEKALLWQEDNLKREHLARIHLLREGATGASNQRVVVRFPNGESRLMSPGPSSLISKAVIEEFTARFLHKPAVVFLSESRRKVVERDERLARRLHLDISAEELLPDIVLADLGPRTMLVFVEAVASDGPVDQKRKRELTAWAVKGGFSERNLAFVTAMRAKTDDVFRKTASAIAWGSFVWFLSEPDYLIYYRRDGNRQRLSEILGVED